MYSASKAGEELVVEEVEGRSLYDVVIGAPVVVFFFSSRRRHTRSYGDWSSDVCSSDLLGVLAERNLAVDFRNDSELLRLACFEQFRDARQTAGDVLGLGGLARNLRDYVARLDRRAFGHVDVSANRQEVTRDVVRARQLGGLALRVLDRDTRAHVEVLELDDNVGARAGTFVDPLLHRLAFDDIAVLNRAADFGDDRRRVRIPFGDQLARFDLVALGLAQLGAVHERVTLAFALAHAAAFVGDLRGDNNFAMPRHHDQVAVAALDGVDAMQAHHAFVANFQRGLLGAPAGGAADVEGTHRELRARLANRLRGNDSDRLAQVDEVAAAEIASVTFHAHALARLAGKHGANLDSLDARIFDALDLVLIDHLVGLHQHFVGERVTDVFEGDAAEHAIAEAFDDLTAFDQRRHLDSVQRAAIVLDNDRVLRHVDQAAGKVTRVRRLERGVGQALARAVSRDEVLQNGQTLAKVRRDRSLDDFTRRLRHQAAQSRQLANLLLGTAGARVGHDENRVERRPGDSLALVVLAEDLRRQSLDNGAADLILNFRPDIRSEEH